MRAVLTNWNPYALGDQEFWCNVFGVKLNKTVIDGSEITKAYREGRIVDIVDHCAEDLRRTEELYLKITDRVKVVEDERKSGLK